MLGQGGTRVGLGQGGQDDDLRPRSFQKAQPPRCGGRHDFSQSYLAEMISGVSAAEVENDLLQTLQDEGITTGSSSAASEAAF